MKIILPLCLLGLLLSACGEPQVFNDTSKTYYGGSAEACARIDFTCPKGEEPFYEGETCGCTTGK